MDPPDRDGGEDPRRECKDHRQGERQAVYELETVGSQGGWSAGQVGRLWKDDRVSSYCLRGRETYAANIFGLCMKSEGSSAKTVEREGCGKRRRKLTGCRSERS